MDQQWGNQWSEAKMGEMWSCLLVPVKRCAAEGQGGGRRR